MDVLEPAEIDARLEGGRWKRVGEGIVREVAFADFRQALAFVNRVGRAAEEAGHHPDLLLHSYRHVRVINSTHSVGGVTALDLALAQTIDGLVSSS